MQFPKFVHVFLTMRGSFLIADCFGYLGVFFEKIGSQVFSARRRNWDLPPAYVDLQVGMNVFTDGNGPKWHLWGEPEMHPGE